MVHFPASDNQSGHLDEIWTIHSKRTKKVKHFWGKFCLTIYDELHIDFCLPTGHTSNSAWFPQSGWLPIVCLVCYSGEGEGGWDTPWRQVGSDTTSCLIQLSRTVNCISLWRKLLEIQIVWRILWLSVKGRKKKIAWKVLDYLIAGKLGISNQTSFFKCNREASFPHLQLDPNGRWRPEAWQEHFSPVSNSWLMLWKSLACAFAVLLFPF